MTENEFKKQYGEKLKKKLDEYPMTQKELSQDTKIDASVISRYASGATAPSLINAVKIAQSLMCDLTDFVDIDTYLE